jgi:hypothetical protein
MKLPQNRPRGLTPKIFAVMELLESGECKTTTAAAKRAGVSREQASRVLNRPDIKAWIDAHVRSQFAVHGKLRAGRRMLELVDSDSAKTSFDASRHVLAVGGVLPPERGAMVNINLNGNNPGYVLDYRSEKTRHIKYQLPENAVGAVLSDADPIGAAYGGRLVEQPRKEPALIEHEPQQEKIHGHD